jgi:hypothetical protein
LFGIIVEDYDKNWISLGKAIAIQHPKYRTAVQIVEIN